MELADAVLDALGYQEEKHKNIDYLRDAVARLYHIIKTDHGHEQLVASVERRLERR